MKKQISILLIGLVIFISCKENQKCEKLPTTFSSYKTAVATVENTHFTFSETKRTYRSSFIQKISYYSCDGKIGYLIVQIKNKKYLYSNISKHLWEDFKEAPSYGRFYGKYIKLRE